MLELARRIYAAWGGERAVRGDVRAGLPVRREAARAGRQQGEAAARLGAADRLRDRPARGHRTGVSRDAGLGRGRRSRARRAAVRAVPGATRLHRLRHRQQHGDASTRSPPDGCRFARRAPPRRWPRRWARASSPGTDLAALARADVIIITLGTPVDDFNNPIFLPIENLLRAALPHLHAGQLLVLRSTVAPGSTEHLGRLIERSTDFTHRPRPLPRLLSGAHRRGQVVLRAARGAADRRRRRRGQQRARGARSSRRSRRP